MSRTPILVVKNTHPSEPDYEDFLPCCWKAGKCSVAIVGWCGLEEMAAFHDCERTEDTAPPRIELTRFAPSRKRVCFRRFGRWKLKTSELAGLSRLAREKALLLLISILLSGCRFGQTDVKPSIEFRKIPPADVGGPDKLDTIEGRVTGVQPGQRIVVYARSEEIWWVQPFSNRPFTKIQGDSRWKNETHLGTEYAALLVDQGYYPPQTAEVLPSIGTGVVALVVAKGQGPAPPVIPAKTLRFSGYKWTVRSAASNRGGSHNSFDPANAWTDESGALHLRIASSQGRWSCAEIRLTRSLGYGTYAFVVRDISHLEPSAVLTFFTWDGFGSEQNRRELDVEISRWGYRDNDNTHYVIQPYYIPANQIRFKSPAGVLTHSFRWEPGQVTFTTVAGSRGTAGARVINQHTFTSGVPVAGGDSVRMNLYIFGKGEIPLTEETEVVIEKFEYLP